MKLFRAHAIPFVAGPIVSFAFLIAILTPDSAGAQDCVGTNPFVLGTVVELPEACPNGSGTVPNTACRWIEVSCEGMRPVRAQVRITEPTPGVTERGTVLLGSGESGVNFYPGAEAFTGELADLGFRVANRAWAGPDGWMTKEVGLRRPRRASARCRGGAPAEPGYPTSGGRDKVSAREPVRTRPSRRRGACEDPDGR